MRSKIIGVLVFICIIVLISLGNKLVETVEKGTFQVKQAAVTGNMTVKFDPGMWGQWFGDIETWPQSQTFFFTADDDEGEKRDQSMEVRFNDGSLAKISGTCRILMPASQSQVLDLVVRQNFKTYNDIEQRLFLPIIRNVLRNTANLMSARESYAEKRNDFINWSREQIQSGIYETKDEVTKRVDLVTGDTLDTTVKVVKRDPAGLPIHQPNPLEGTGILVTNFEIKVFNYSKRVQEQIAEQQNAIMAIATAKAQSARAEQERIKKEAEGKMNVTEAQYQEEEKKIRAVVEAEKRLEVAVLDRKAAKEEKQKLILLGEGEATRRRLVLAADGALAPKLAAWVEVQKTWATAFTNRKVPAYYVAGGNGGGGGGQGVGLSTDFQSAQFANFMNLLMAKNIGLDLTIKKGTIATQ